MRSNAYLGKLLTIERFLILNFHKFRWGSCGPFESTYKWVYPRNSMQDGFTTSGPNALYLNGFILQTTIQNNNSG